MISSRPSTLRLLAARSLTALLLAAQLLALAGCRLPRLVTRTPTLAPSPTQSPSPTMTPRPSPTTTPSPTFTPLPTLTATWTPEPTATITPTALPSPTPSGFFSQFDGGYSLTYPSSWEIIDQTGTRLDLQDNTGGLALSISSAPEKEPQTNDQLLVWLQTGLAKGESVTKSGITDIQLAAAKATAIDAVFKSSTTKLDIRLVYAYQGNRGYYFLVMTRSGALKNRASTLNRLFQSVTLFVPQLYGLPRDQTLFVVGGEPSADDLDPATSTSSAADYIGLLYSGLVRLSPGLKVIPDLAEKWTTSQGGKIYTFSLNPQARFADGSPITATAVKNSWERTCDPKTGGSLARTYLGDIQGVAEKLDGKADTLSGVRVIDDQTLEVTLVGPRPYFLSKITYPTAMVMDTSSAHGNKDTWALNPNSSGPYRVRENKKQEAFILERNPGYPTPAMIPVVVFLENPGGPPLSLYEEGTIDMVSLSDLDFNTINKPEHALHAELHSLPSMCTTMIYINNTLPPFDDPNVRRAFRLATDQAQLIDKLTDNTAIPAISVLPPAMPGFLSDRKPFAFDPVAAKAALNASKYAGSLPEIVLAAAGYGDSVPQSATLLVDMWMQNLGIKVKVTLYDPTDPIKAARNSKAHLIIDGWCADYPDPENFLDLLFHSQSEINSSHFSLPEMDKLLEQAHAENDPSKRLQLYQQAETLLLDSTGVIPLFHYLDAELVSPRIQGYVMSPIHTSTIPFLSLSK